VTNNDAAPATSNSALRALGLPVPIRVRTDEDGLPLELLVPRRGARPLAPQTHRRSPARTSDARRHAVEAIEELWRVAEEWWRERPIRRTYVRLLVDGGRPLTIYRDEVGIDGRPAWYLQRYATSEGALLGDSALGAAALDQERAP
jgi:hypothetical protein